MKQIGLCLLAGGLLFFIAGILFNLIARVKKAKEEIEIINKKAMLGAAYTENFDEKKEKPLVITDATGLIDEDDTDEYKTTLL